MFRRNTDCQSVRPAEWHSAPKITVIALVSQSYKPAGRTGLRPVFLAENSHAETGITDPVYNYSARSATKGLTRVARRAGTEHDAAAIAVKSPATAL